MAEIYDPFKENVVVEKRSCKLKKRMNFCLFAYPFFKKMDELIGF